VGTVQAQETATVSGKLMGTVQAVMVREGDAVEAGDLLVRLDERQVDAELRQAEAALAEAHEAESAVLAARQSAEAGAVQAGLEYQRHKTLFESGATSRQQFDAVDARYKQATAALSQAEAGLAVSRVTKPMEKLLWEIPGVEYIYSTSSPGLSMAVVRFYVGQNEEQSIVRLQSKLMANMDRIPCCATQPLIKPRYIDDVPILALTFWGDGVDHYVLRRVAAEVEKLVKREPDVSLTSLIGGNSRTVEVRIDPVRLSASHLDAQAVAEQLFVANQSADAGSYPSIQGQIVIHADGFLKTLQDVESVVVGVYMGRPGPPQDHQGGNRRRSSHFPCRPGGDEADRRGSKHLPLKPDARSLRRRRCGRCAGKPGLRHSGDEQKN